MTLSHAELRRAYRDFNRRYFADKLPADCDVYFAPAQEAYAIAQNENGEWSIQIDTKYAIDARMWKLALLHEMTHIACWPNLSHGKRFQGEMLRLAQAGALARLW